MKTILRRASFYRSFTTSTLGQKLYMQELPPNGLRKMQHDLDAKYKMTIMTLHDSLTSINKNRRGLLQLSYLVDKALQDRNVDPKKIATFVALQESIETRLMACKSSSWWEGVNKLNVAETNSSDWVLDVLKQWGFEAKVEQIDKMEWVLSIRLSE